MKQQINLAATLPKPPKYWLTPVLLLQLVGVFLALLLLTSGYHYVRYMLQSSQMSSLQLQQKTDLQTLMTMANSSPGVKLQLEIDRLAKELNNKTALLASIAQQPTTDCAGFSDYLTNLANAHTADVWLRKIQIKQDGNIQLSGTTLASTSALVFLQQLEKQPCFADKPFQRFKWLDTNGPAPGIDFTLSTQGLDNGTTTSKSTR